MSLRFEWDPNKADSNFTKHDVSFEEAATVFDDPAFITLLDVSHSHDEERYLTIGLSEANRLILIAHTERAGQIHLISARKATKNERRFYEEDR